MVHRAGHLNRHWWINLHNEGRTFALVQISIMWGYIVPIVVQEGLQNKSLGQLNLQMGEAMFMLNGERNSEDRGRERSKLSGGVVSNS